MKKLGYAVLSLVLAISLTSCSDDDNDKEIENLPVMLMGQWYGTDNGKWVIYDFQANNTLDVTIKGESEIYRGVYACVGNHISSSYHGSNGFEWNVSAVSAYFMRYKANGSNDEKILNRIVGELVMTPGETTTLNAQTMIPGATVSQCTIEDSSIANIDSKTHKITAISSGETFISLVTEFGSPKIHLVVSNNITEEPEPK